MRDLQDGKGSVQARCDTAFTGRTIAETVFPGIEMSAFYWSSSPTYGNDYAAWSVGFGKGNVDGDNRKADNAVRLVR